MVNTELFYSNKRLNKNKLKEEWVKKNLPEYYDEINSYRIGNIRFSQIIYNYLNKIDVLPKCLLCKNLKRFIGFDKGYNDFCSKKCAQKNSKQKEIETRRANTLAKYGVLHTSQLESVKKKQRDTNISKYGATSPTLDTTIRKKQKYTMLEKYGVEYSGQNKDLLKKSLDTRKRLYDGNIKKTYSDLNIISIPIEGILNIKCNSCKEIYEINTQLLRLRHLRYKVNPCLNCNPIKSYSGQNDIYDLLDNNKINYIKGDRKILGGKEIDIYIPDKNIAIEFNGIYWHSTLFKDKNYHLSKKEECEKLGIRLIHIWEDQWIYKKEIVLSMLNNVLSIIPRKIMARKCEISVVDNKLSKDFLEKNHLQGNIQSSIKYGLFYEKELVSIMTFGKYRRSTGKVSKDNEYELYRFCNKINTIVVGGFSKLLNFFIESNNPENIITYTKRDWSGYKSNQKSVYDKYFTFDGSTPYSYWYFDSKLNRSHRFKYRKSVLNTNLKEQEYMIDNGYLIVYDSGNFKFIWSKK